MDLTRSQLSREYKMRKRKHLTERTSDHILWHNTRKLFKNLFISQDFHQAAKWNYDHPTLKHR